MKNFRNEKGFTLIELMVVILIIGILVAIAVPVFNSARDNANRRTCQANLRTLDGAVQSWKAGTSSATYPTPSSITDDLVSDYIKSASATGNALPACPKYGAYSVTDGGTNPPLIQCTAAGIAEGHTYP